MDKLRMESPDMTAQNIDRIAALFPNCITEMLDEERSTPEKKVYKRAVNFELLKQILSPDVVDGDEAYEFTWVGKKAAIVEANKPIRKTLRPCVAESKDWDNTENLYIEGDNLEVLKLLQESYRCPCRTSPSSWAAAPSTPTTTATSSPVLTRIFPKVWSKRSHSAVRSAPSSAIPALHPARRRSTCSRFSSSICRRMQTIFPSA